MNDIIKDKIVTINVGGKTFQTYHSNIIKYPDTLLGICFSDRWNNSDISFHDRSDLLFNNILDFYRTGILIKPQNISDEKWKSELEYWNIEFTKSDEELLTINVGGKLFQTCRSTIMKYPDTLLATQIDNIPFHDRSDILFDFILNFYRTGDLIKPKNISDKIWQRELSYWKIPKPEYEQLIDEWLNMGSGPSQYLFNWKQRDYIVFNFESEPDNSKGKKLVDLLQTSKSARKYFSLYLYNRGYRNEWTKCIVSSYIEMYVYSHRVNEKITPPIRSRSAKYYMLIVYKFTFPL